MPIPILVACIAVGISAVSTGAGVSIFKNNKFNKAQKEWQEQKVELQNRIVNYQTKLIEREERILELQKKLTERTKQLEDTTRRLYENDRMIEVLEKRHKELKSIFRIIIAIILFRYGKHQKELNEIIDKVAKTEKEKEVLENIISKAKKMSSEIEEKIKIETMSERYYENEIKDISKGLSLMED